MGTAISLNGVSFTIPALGENNWGTSVANYLIALSTGVLSKAGGTFTLTADTDFGANFGLKSIYYKSRGTVASAGVFRLANAESIGWRNFLNSADLLFKVNASNILEFDGNPIPTIALGAADTVLQMNGAGTAYEFATINNANVAASAAIAYSKLAALTSANILVGSAGNVATVTAVTGDIGIDNTGLTSISSGVIVNADVSASAAIAYSKLAALTSANILVGSAGNVATVTAVTGDIGIDNTGVTSISSGVIVNADVNASAAIAYSKLALTGSILNADINASAAIAYSKLALTGAILNADINASAAIAYSKLALTGSVLNADINASAAIARSKLAAGTADHVVINAASTGVFSSEATLAKTRGGAGADMSSVTFPSTGVIVTEAGSATLTTKTLTSPVLNTGVSGTAVDTDGTLAANSDTKLASQKATKTYVDTSITAVTGAADAVDDRWNYSISASASAGALTISLLTKGGSTPSAGSPVKLGFRNATIATGDYSVVSYTAATTLVIPSTATFGWSNGDTRYVYVYGQNNAGTGIIAASSQMFNENTIASSTTIGAGSSSLSTLYATTGVASKAIRYLGKILITVTTAGTWLTPTAIDIQYQPNAGTAMDDAEATRLGLKSYAHGTSYNNSVAPTITLSAGGGSLSSIAHSDFMPYQMQDGSWRMRLSFSAVVSSTSRSFAEFTVQGVLSPNITQAVSGYSGSAAEVQKGTMDNSTNTFTVAHVTATTTSYRMSGDVRLNTKPTWAYG